MDSASGNGPTAVIDDSKYQHEVYCDTHCHDWLVKFDDSWWIGSIQLSTKVGFLFFFCCMLLMIWSDT